MRNKLKKRDGQRIKVRAKVKRFGTKIGYKGKMRKTILFTEVKDKTGTIITDHIWFIMGKRFKEAELNERDRVQFYARIKSYTKGYKNKKIDYKLSYPSKVVKLSPKG